MKKCFPLNLWNYNSFIPKNTNIENPNLYLIEQIQKMGNNTFIAQNGYFHIKDQLSKLINSKNKYNNSINNSQIKEKIIYNHNNIDINPIYNFYKSTEKYLKETNNICKYYKNSRNYILKYNILNNIQFPNISLKENENGRKIKIFNSATDENYRLYNSELNLNNNINQIFTNTVDGFNSK